MKSSRSTIDNRARRAIRSGFTLIELLVVVFIIVLLSAATLPAVLPALNSRRVSEGSRILQAEMSRQRDLAVRANAPRGFRLLPDPFDPTRPNVLTSSRLIAIEPAPDYIDGLVYRFQGMGTDEAGNNFTSPQLVDATFFPTAVIPTTYLQVVERKFNTIGGVAVPSEPTSWYWNIRQGDKIRLADSGKEYTIAGPVQVSGAANVERYINFGPASTFTTGPGAGPAFAERLFVLNGEDDDGDGFIDEECDGVDNDGDGIIDPGFNGIDDDGANGIDDIREMYLHKNADGSFVYPGYTYFSGITSQFATRQNEFEFEKFTGKLPSVEVPVKYSIQRRPLPVEGARDIQLPTNVVIDLTTWNAGLTVNGVPERSRLPVDPFTGFVDVMVAPNGQIIVAGPTSNMAPSGAYPYYHFWLTEIDDVYEPGIAPTFALQPVTSAKPYRLPMPKDAGNDARMGSPSSPSLNVPNLKGERRLLSVNARSGAISSTAIETFYLNNPSYPYEAAESGVRDSQP